ncbi:MAG: glycosyltransferase family 4 protein [Calditrichaeota bacterium]|nr:glycosyltransferase family 4 protein [Calditrichota bacterium]
MLPRFHAGGALVAVEAYVHKWLGSYRKNVDRFHSPSRFLRSKMIQYGWDADRIDWLPYTLAVHDFTPHYAPGDYFVFVGRLQREKGIQVLIEAMQYVKRGRLVVIGTGPLGEALESRARELGLTNVEFAGYKSGDELRNLVAGARFTVVPSVVYDNSPLTIYESFSLGKPVVGARIGGIPELIEPGVDGELCEPGDARSLAAAITAMWDRGQELREMGKRAREKAERLFEPEQHYRKLMAIYEKASNGS